MDCATWWFDHAGRTYLHAVAVRHGDEKEEAEQIEKLVSGAEEWGTLVGSEAAGTLMLEHVAATQTLIAAASAGDAAAMDASVDALMKNVDRQADLYASRFPGFPGGEWRRAFAGHVAATAAYVLAMASGDAEDFRRNVEAAHRERNALARLWSNVCAGS